MRAAPGLEERPPTPSLLVALPYLPRRDKRAMVQGLPLSFLPFPGRLLGRLDLPSSSLQLTRDRLRDPGPERWKLPTPNPAAVTARPAWERSTSPPLRMSRPLSPAVPTPPPAHTSGFGLEPPLVTVCVPAPVHVPAVAQPRHLSDRVSGN